MTDSQELMLPFAHVNTLPSIRRTFDMPNPLYELPMDATNEPVLNYGGQYQKPEIRIIEEPAPKVVRFRYESESRFAGNIPGATSTLEHPTFPAIKIERYNGPVMVQVSCVTKKKPYLVHPHNLVGREETCTNGICRILLENNENTIINFPNLGIQRVKKKDFRRSLESRLRDGVDPFGNGFHDFDQRLPLLDSKAVRLCFQAFAPWPRSESWYQPASLSRLDQWYQLAPPVVSVPIYDKKNASDLCIKELSSSSAPAKKSQKIILLCERVDKEDVKVRFYKSGVNNQVVWEDFGYFDPKHVHKGFAITLKTPIYPDPIEAGGEVNVFIQLLRPSDGATSMPPFLFTFTGDNAGPSMPNPYCSVNGDPHNHINGYERETHNGCSPDSHLHEHTGPCRKILKVADRDIG